LVIGVECCYYFVPVLFFILPGFYLLYSTSVCHVTVDGVMWQLAVSCDSWCCHV